MNSATPDATSDSNLFHHSDPSDLIQEIFMKRRSAFALVPLAFSALLTACGGGGSEGEEEFDINATITTFPLEFYSNREVFESPYTSTTRTGIKTGTVTNNTYTNGSVYEQVSVKRTRLPDSLFEGIAIVPYSTETSRTKRSVNGMPFSDVNSVSFTAYNSIDGNIVGGVNSSSYMVASRVNPYPEQVKTGDTGVRYEGVVYRDNTKATRLGSVSSTWKVESVEPRKAMEDAIAVISYTQNNYDTNNVLISRSTTRSRLTFQFNANTYDYLRTSKALTTVEEDLNGSETGVYTTIWN